MAIRMSSLLPRLHGQSFVGAVAVVVGAGTSVGAAAATELALRGANVALVDRDLVAIEAVANRVRSAGGRASIFQADVTRREHLDQLADEIVLNVGPIDIVIIHAGDELASLLADLAESDWDWVRSTGIDSVVYACRAFGTRMRANGAGHIVNVLPWTAGTGACQSTARAAVLAFSGHLRIDFAIDGVGVSAVEGQGGRDRPEQFAAAICQAIETDRAIVAVRKKTSYARRWSA